MTPMSTEIAVLRALLRLARRPNPPTLEDLLARVDADAGEVHHALASLARVQLVLRRGDSARLSLSGLAVAVAVTASAKRERPANTGTPRSPSARILPMQRSSVAPRVRRHRAA